MMMVVVAYDVNTEDEKGRRRLRRVARRCESHGQRVQNSVFECYLDPARWTSFRAVSWIWLTARMSDSPSRMRRALLWK